MVIVQFLHANSLSNIIILYMNVIFVIDMSLKIVMVNRYVQQSTEGRQIAVKKVNK
jgi:hypothetical protein